MVEKHVVTQGNVVRGHVVAICVGCLAMFVMTLITFLHPEYYFYAYVFHCGWLFLFYNHGRWVGRVGDVRWKGHWY